MKVVMVMFDTLMRKFLPSYGCNWTKLPNFKRLEQHCTTFDNFYAGSLPCMPARRELHTGKHNFLHRSWGPLEPFDRSCVEVLRAEGVYTHLCTDHSHYWEDGGCTYHNRYDVDRRATALWRTISRWTCQRNAIPSIRLASP